ncbi:hypothetical protein UlMin_041230 [Ulmus minor]
MYKGVATSVRSVGEMSSEFLVLVGLHQGSVLSLYLFALIMNELMKHIQDDKLTSRVLCDRRMPARLKGKCYRTIVRPFMLFSSKCRATMRQHTHKMTVAKMCMLGCTQYLFTIIELHEIQNGFNRAQQLFSF